LSANKIAKEVSEQTGIGILKTYEEDDQADGGFEWSMDDEDYHVQIAKYNSKPFLLHKSLPNGCIQMMAACSSVDTLCIEINAILTSS